MIIYSFLISFNGKIQRFLFPKIRQKFLQKPEREQAVPCTGVPVYQGGELHVGKLQIRREEQLDDANDDQKVAVWAHDVPPKQQVLSMNTQALRTKGGQNLSPNSALACVLIFTVAALGRPSFGGGCLA